jgi:hypothetical protein
VWLETKHLREIEVLLERIEGRIINIEKEQHTLMSQVSDFAAKTNASLAQIQTGIANLDTMIQNFQNSPGTLSAADQAALDAISAQSAALATAANQIPTPPAPTA